MYNSHIDMDKLTEEIKDIVFLTVKQAAERLDLEESHVRRLLMQGKIAGRKWGRDWMVTSLNYQRQRKKGGGRKPQQRRID
jgi:excisionase family DNA binding protein